ncbi:hypothetical protein INR49_018497 [Caranx melampygus]|nr:hypothetical protein INR49_018497 [Caranx melampygus]
MVAERCPVLWLSSGGADVTAGLKSRILRGTDDEEEQHRLHRHVRQPKEDEKNGQQSSDLILDGGLRSGKHRAAAMKEPVQHSGEVYYGCSSKVDAAGLHAGPGWSQEAPVSAWGQNFGPYMGGVNVRSQMVFHKGAHEGVALPMGGENQLPGGPVQVYRDASQSQAQGRGLEWEQHSAAAMHPAQLQAYQHGHKAVEIQGQPHEDSQSVELQQEPGAQTCNVSAVPDPCPEKVTANPAESSDAQPAAPRRSRRLSREGQSPLGPPSTNIWSQASKEPPPSHNGVAGGQKAGESQVTTGGVIQINSRRRRASKEINLETLAHTAAERQKILKQEDGPSGRQATMVPLVIPVSVPVHRSQVDSQGSWAQGRLGQGERPTGPQSDRKPSVIVARRRSLRNSMTESFGQDGENDSSLDEDGKTKFKRRPRPEPLIIPPPKPSTFIPPSVYSSISTFQSNLRSPVRLPDNPLTLPPYTPPPILSPVREGSGLYFSTLMANIAVSNQILPPPPTPKSATRSLLRSTVSILGIYQAEIPDMQDQASSQFDQHKADLVWVPVENSHLKHGDQECLEDLMNMACCSVLRGGGTNQELFCTVYMNVEVISL